MTTTEHTLKDLKCEDRFISLGDTTMGILSEPGEIINTNQNITLLPILDEVKQGFEIAQKARIYMLKFFFIKGKRKGIIVGDKILYADTREEVPDTEKVFITFNRDGKMIYADTKVQVHGDDNDNFVVVQIQEKQKKQGGKKRRSSHKKRRSSHKKRRSSHKKRRSSHKKRRSRRH